MKEKIIKFLQSEKSIFVIIFILEFVLTIFITPNQYDDATFLGWLESNHNVFHIVVDRYATWTSRVIIDFTLFSILKTSKYIWIVLQAAMMTLIGYAIVKLFIKDNHRKELSFMMILLLLSYPLDIMAGAGWGASTANYIWPLATTLFCFIPIKKIWYHERIKWFEYILYILALLYGCNQEQTCAIILGTYLFFNIIRFIKEKKIHPFMIVQLILSIASLLFILTTPGNYIRQNTEIIMQFPDFKMLTIQDKISLGLTATMGTILKTYNIPFGILSMIIVSYIFVTYKEKLYRVVALIPLTSICVLGYFGEIFYKVFPYLNAIKEELIAEKVILTAAHANNLFYALPVIFSIVVLFSMVISILLIFKNLQNNIAIFVFLVGLASRLIMGFSPTIFASATRTMVFFDFAMLIVALLIWQEWIKKNDKNERKIQRRIYAIVEMTAILQYSNVLLGILLTQK